MDPFSLGAVLDGTVTVRGDAAYERLRTAHNFNALVAARYPRAIVAAHSAADVVHAVRYARSAGLAVAVRSGGHNWVNYALADDALLIDLGGLNGFSIDAAARTARVGPAVHGVDFDRALAAEGLAFPVGHCSSVGLGGFLLSGGLGWNSNGWGPACASIRAADVVLADGQMVRATAATHPDLFWALCGGGPGFFGVVTGFELQLRATPRAILSSSYCYPLDCLPDLGAFAADIAPRLPVDVELTIFCMPAPPGLHDAASKDNGYVALLAATAFVDDAAAASASLAMLEHCPVIDRCLDRTRGERTPIAALLKQSDAMWPDGHRYLADTIWADAAAGDQCALLRDRFRAAPSGDCLSLTWFATGAPGDRFAAANMAFAMGGSILTVAYAVWQQADGDARHTAWHKETFAGLDTFATGHYVAETDLLADPNRHRRCYTAAAWAELEAVHDHYDPTQLFCGPFQRADRAR